jgi:hypothetical protein
VTKIDLNRRELFQSVGASITALTLSNVLVGQDRGARGGSFFPFDLASKHAAGEAVDPSVSASVYKAAARWLNRTLAETDGKLSIELNNETFELTFQKSSERAAIDFTRCITRGIWRERMLRGVATSAEPSDEEIKGSCDTILSLRLRYRNVPMAVSVWAADNEANGSSFGNRAEMDGWNRIAKAHDMPAVKGPFRDKAAFLDAIENTPPAKLSDGTLYFGTGFNGHGAPGGVGMSLHSNGSESLSRLMTAVDIARGLERHCDKWKELYSEAHTNNKSAYIGVMLFCCYSQDQARKASGNEQSSDLLSKLESLAGTHKLRPFVFSVGETMRPGYYQPGTVIPVLGVRAFIRAADSEKGALTVGQIYSGAISFGGDGILSNPTLFVPDRKRPKLFQIGEVHQQDSSLDALTPPRSKLLEHVAPFNRIS